MTGTEILQKWGVSDREVHVKLKWRSLGKFFFDTDGAIHEDDVSLKQMKK